MTDASHSQRPRASQRTRWALIASIALNLFLIGWGLGAIVNRPPFGPPPPIADRMRSELSPEGGARIAQRLQTFDSEMVNDADDVDTTRVELRRLAGANPFDGAAITNVLDRLSSNRAEQNLRMTRRIVDMLQDLDPADRRVFVEALFPPFPPKRSDARLAPPPLK